MERRALSPTALKQTSARPDPECKTPEEGQLYLIFLGFRVLYATYSLFVLRALLEPPDGLPKQVQSLP